MGKEQKALLTSVESRHGQWLWTGMRGSSSSPGGGFPAPALGSRDIQERSQRWLQSVGKGPCLGQVIDLSYHCGIFLANLLCSKIQVTRGAALPAGCWFPAGLFPLLRSTRGTGSNSGASPLPLEQLHSNRVLPKAVAGDGLRRKTRSSGAEHTERGL